MMITMLRWNKGILLYNIKKERNRMHIAISGAQSTGKSTLLVELEKHLQDFTFKKEITRELKSRGFLINEHGNDETQNEIMKIHSEYSVLPGNVLYDRCVLDGVVYTHYLYTTNQVSLETLQNSTQIFRNVIDNYNKIFYIKPEFDIVDDNERSINISFRDEIVNLFDFYIKEYSIDVKILTGSVEERAHQLLKEIRRIN